MTAALAVMVTNRVVVHPNDRALLCGCVAGDFQENWHFGRASGSLAFNTIPAESFTTRASTKGPWKSMTAELHRSCGVHG
jgi:hypothetical protein